MSETIGSPRQWSAVEWLSGGVFDPLREINGQCIELLCAMADRGQAPVPRGDARGVRAGVLTRAARARGDRASS